ncbi:MAG: hypothetical protein ACK55Z_09420, partial [bacterium]
GHVPLRQGHPQEQRVFHQILCVPLQYVSGHINISGVSGDSWDMRVLVCDMSCLIHAFMC